MTAPTAPRASVFRLATLVIAGAARLVPEPARSEWRREWDAELWYRVAALEARGALDLPEQSRLIRRCLGAYHHALWIAARGAARDLRSTPARSALAVSAVAVALAAGSVAFALATEVRVGAAPYPSDGRAVRIFNTAPAADLDRTALSGYELVRFRAENRSLEVIAGFRRARVVVETGATRLPVRGARVTADWFRAAGVEPVPTGSADRLGFDAGGRPNPTVLVREDLRRDLTDAQGPPQSIMVDGHRLTIVGVLPESFRFPDPDTRIWLPLAPPDLTGTVGDRTFAALGRLREGVSAEQARTDLKGLSLRLQAEHPEGYLAFYRVPWGIDVVPVGALPRELTLIVGWLFAAALMLVAGAGGGVGVLKPPVARGRLVGMLVLAGGTAIAAGLVVLALRGVTSVIGADLPALSRSSSVSTAGYVAGGAGLAGLLAWLARGERRDVVFVALAMASAVTLLAGAGVVGGVYRRILAVGPGFDPRGLVALRSLDGRFVAGTVRGAASVPGIVGATAVSSAPMFELPPNTTIETERPSVAGSPSPGVDVRIVSPEYFRVMGLPLAGRSFTEGLAEVPREVVINQALADRFWPDGRAVGARLRVHRTGAPTPLLRVVGIASNTRRQGSAARPVAELYLPPGYGGVPLATLILRTSLTPEAALAALRTHGVIGMGAAVTTPVALGELARAEQAPYRDAGRIVAVAGLIAAMLAVIACAVTTARPATLGAAVGGVSGVAVLWLGTRAVDVAAVAGLGITLAMLATGTLLRRRLAPL